MSDIENEIRSHVESFVNELSALVRQQALNAVSHALHDGNGVGHLHEAEPRLARRGPGRPRKNPIPAAAIVHIARRGRPSRTPGSPNAHRPAGEKRTAEELKAVTEQVCEYIHANGGQGIEQIAKSLGTLTKELMLPIKKLLLEKRISSKGQKRATRYFPK